MGCAIAAVYGLFLLAAAVGAILTQRHDPRGPQLLAVLAGPALLRLWWYQLLPNRLTRALRHYLGEEERLSVGWLRTLASWRWGSWSVAYRRWPPGISDETLRKQRRNFEQTVHASLEIWYEHRTMRLRAGTRHVPRHISYWRWQTGAPKVCSKRAPQLAAWGARRRRPRAGGLQLSVGPSSEGRLRSDLIDVEGLLVAGQRGSGKSAFLRQLLVDLVLRLRPEQLQLALIDLKNHGVELGIFDGLPHLIAPVAKGSLQEAHDLLNRVSAIMEERNRIFKEAGVVKIADYNALPNGAGMPLLLIVIDEQSMLAPLVVDGQHPDRQLRRQCEQILAEISRLSRNAGIHIILATQRPEKDVLPGAIKDQFPATVSFGVREAATSHIILRNPAAANLPPIRGAGIYQAERKQVRFQAPWLSVAEARELLAERIHQLEPYRATQPAPEAARPAPQSRPQAATTTQTNGSGAQQAQPLPDWYQEYLKSEVWNFKRKAVWKRAGGRCERVDEDTGQRCVRRMNDAHHLTYKRVPHEPIGDLLGVCRECHHYLEPFGPPDDPIQLEEAKVP